MANTILLVDDDEDLRSELRDFLEEYSVQEASTGREALELIRRAHEISLVVLDIKLPGISGLEVLKEIKRTDPGISIIIFTGHSSKDVAIEALKNHADDYIEKPIDFEKLRRAIEKRIDVKNHQEDISSLGIKGKLEKVKRFINLNLLKPISLEAAAQTVGLSPKYLSRVFKQYGGIGFEDYKLNLKMEKAKELLAQSGYNVNQISEKLGYENAESFIRRFRKFTQETPTGYRRKISKQVFSLKKP
jgi:two-component system response regulator YesN